MHEWGLQELHGTKTKLDFRTSLLKKLPRLTIRGAMIMMLELKMLCFSFFWQHVQAFFILFSRSTTQNARVLYIFVHTMDFDFVF